MKRIFSALAIVLSFGLPSFGNDLVLDQNYFEALCQPGSAAERALDPADRKEIQVLRREFLLFLNDPEPHVRAMEKSALVGSGGDIGDVLESLFQYSMTCTIVNEFPTQLAAQGCRTKAGKISYGKIAIGLCADLSKKVKI